MSDSRQALFQEVLDRPADDAPRHAYAGYCDAQGDPYGAFIRAQLERTEALRYGSDDDAWRAYDEAQKVLARNKNGAAWKNGIENLPAAPEFIRGFVDRVVIDARTYLEHVDDLYRRAPIRQLVLTGVGDLAPRIAADPHLSRIVWLSLDEAPTIGDAGIAAIAASPHVRGLRVLEVTDQDLTAAGLDILCASKQLPALVYANVSGNKFEDPIEGYGTDWMTGRIVAEGIYLSSFGKELEKKHGTLAWLHGPSRLRHYPPLSAEF